VTRALFELSFDLAPCLSAGAARVATTGNSSEQLGVALPEETTSFAPEIVVSARKA
jgi:hypothetical protein